ncbi:YfaP family protein [Singulisphaera sp. PoT]|uniref:YfaP family protein n=1 Tax=Singulisphaera sp. PoT TaxID=3411797 RepID=UPI003BF5BCF7
MTFEVKIARPAPPIARPAQPALAIDVPEEDAEPEAPESFFTRENLRSWGSSLALHALILLVLAFWYFGPKLNAQRPFNARLAGSENGVPEGLTITGGLNTELALPLEPMSTPEPVPSMLKPLDVPPLDVKPSLKTSGANKPSADGGLDNPNPGAGDGDGFGLAKFGQGGETIHGIEVKVGDPQFTLLWDTDADLDLHVIEPGGKEIYWEDPKGKEGLGGELDVDNTKGFGPENIYWLRTEEGSDEKVKGHGPPGEYKWFVNYWGGFGGIPKPTKWKVRIKHDGKVTVVNGRFRALNEKSKVHSLVVKPEAEQTK